MSSMTVNLTTPISEDDIRALRVGDRVLLNGVIVTGRDAAHKYMVENFVQQSCPDSEKELHQILMSSLAGSAIFHCGPVVKKRDDGTYEFVAAGPTTSIREEPYQADVIEHFGLRAVIGKGGMGEKTLQGCREHGCVYLHGIGGAGTLTAQSVKEVIDVYKLEFGIPEAFWKICVENFPCVVTMDSHGESLHAKIKSDSEKKFEEILARGVNS